MEVNQSENESSRLIIGRFLSFLKPYWSWMALGILAILLEGIWAVLNAYAFKNVVDNLTQGAYSKLIHTLLLMLGIVGAGALINLISRYTNGRIVEYGMYDLREKTVTHLNRIPIFWSDTRQTGDILTRVNNDIGIVQNFMQNSAMYLLLVPLSFTAALSYSLILSWKLTLVNILSTLLLMTLSMRVSKPIEKFTKMQQESLSDANAIAQEGNLRYSHIQSIYLAGIVGKKVQLRD